MAQYLLQMEKRIETAQTSLKSDLQAAQAKSENRMETAQVKSEERMHSNNQLITSSAIYKALFIGMGTAVAGFTLLEGTMRGLGYELTLKKSS